MKIRYDFVNGETKEIEVDEQIYNASKEINREIHLNNRREKRRHYSLDSAALYELEPADESINIENEFFKIDDFEKLIAPLNENQKDLLRRVFFHDEKAVDIARELGVGENAISNRLARIYDKLKKFL